MRQFIWVLLCTCSLALAETVIPFPYRGKGGNVNVNTGIGEPDGDLYLSTGEHVRVWLDHDGVLHYNGSEVATVRQLEMARWEPLLLAALMGVCSFFVCSILFVLVRKKRIRELLRWRSAQKQRKDKLR